MLIAPVHKPSSERSGHGLTEEDKRRGLRYIRRIRRELCDRQLG